MSSVVLSDIASAFALGVMGSGHCVLVCGSLAAGHAMGHGAVPLHSRAVPTVEREWQRLLLVNMGRILNYMLLAAFVAMAGSTFALVPGAAAVLRTVGALLLLLAGLHFAGWSTAILRVESPLRRSMACVQSALRAAWGRHVRHPIVAGIVWGAMPCGMVYSAILWAGLSGSVVSAPVRMLAFGVGTIPALLATGWFALRLGRAMAGIRKVGGIVLIGLAVLTLPPVQHALLHADGVDLPAELRWLGPLCGSGASGEQ